ncbi:uncharacterized protein METZ01_LOCUS484651, partial [marine metagenome]
RKIETNSHIYHFTLLVANCNYFFAFFLNDNDSHSHLDLSTYPQVYPQARGGAPRAAV